MKKCLLSVSFIFIALFICTSDVFANSLTYTESAVNDGKAVLLCEYTDPDDPNGNDRGEKIFYFFKPVSQNGYQYYSYWNIFYKKKQSFTDIYYGSGPQIANQTNIHYNSHNERFGNDIEAKFRCPSYSFTDFDYFDEVCFGDYKTCGAHFKNGPFYLQENGNTIFEVINKYASDSVYNSISDEEFLNGDIKAIIINRTMEFTKIKYSFGTTYDMPAFITSYINEIHTHVADDNKYDERAAKIKTKADQDLANGNITQEQHDEIVEKASQSYYDTMGVTSVIGVNPSNDPNCYGLLGVQMTKIVNNIFTFVQFAGPILVVVLTIVDFIKAAATGTQDEIKKSSQRFMKRVIAAMALFFVPLICSLFFDLAGITVPENCIGLDTTQQP